jgi:large subunit ribosomal protein L19
MNKIALIDKTNMKSQLPKIKPGDSVKVHQIIREGGKKRTQVFEGVVLRVSKPNEVNGSILVRKITSGVGVEKSWLLNSPNITKIEVIKRSKVRRAYLTYLRERRGKSARLAETEFDDQLVNVQQEKEEEISKSKKAPDESQLVEESTDDLAKEETKQVQGEDSVKEEDTDEQQLAATETQSGIDKAEKEEEKNN